MQNSIFSLIFIAVIFPVSVFAFTIEDIPKTNTSNPGTSQTTNPDGSTTTNYQDGSSIQTPAGGGVMGTVITGSEYTGGSGSSGTTNSDGTVRLETNPTVTNPPTGSSVEPKLQEGTRDTTNTTNNSTTASGNDAERQRNSSPLSNSAQYPSQGSAGSTNIFDAIAPANTFGGQPLSNLLNQIFYVGLAIAVVLAIVMIVRGGVQYMTIDAAASKDSGKRMVQAALGGLVLAFSGMLILNTINPNLTTLNLGFSPLRLGQFGGSDSISSGQRDPVTGEPIGGPISSKFTDPELEAYTLAKIKEMGFSNLSPADKAAFFPNGGTDEEWLSLVSAMIKNESGFNTNTTYTENFKDNNGNYVVSTGLFQLSAESVRGYGFNLTTEQLKDPRTNIDAGLYILKNWVERDGVISGTGNTGGARYWSVLRPTGKLDTVRNDMKQ